MIGRAEEFGERGDKAQGRWIDNAVIYRLPFAAGGDDAVIAEQSEMLRKCGLTEANARLDLPDGKLAISELTQDHEPPLIPQQAQQRCGAGGAGLKGGKVEFGKIEHGLIIFIDSNLAIANIKSTRRLHHE